MPILPRSSKRQVITLPPRTATVAYKTDVLVVGGGPAGLGAALGAAWTGADVVLVERYGFLGGNATVSLVMPLMSFHTQCRPSMVGNNASLLPNDHGEGDPVVAGVLKVFLERLIASGGAIAPSGETGYTVPFDPEVFKLVALDMLDEAGVKFLFHAFASGVWEKHEPKGVIFETKSGPLVVEADAIIDCTGDGDIAVAAGASYEVGRAEDGLVQPMTLMFRMVEFAKPEFAAYIQENPTQWRGVHGLWDLVAKATMAGDLELPREDILFFASAHPGEISVNSTRINGVLGTNVWDLSYAEWQTRKQMQQIFNFLQKYVPGFKNAYIAQSGVNIGVRETRRILGDYQLTADDVLCARKFSDGIARGSYPIDIHNPEGKGTILKRLPPGEAYDIPLRCLIPKGVDRLLVAGRCISGTHEAHSSYRVMPIAMATGHAAGVCAALSSIKKVSPRHVPPALVQEVLRDQGANLQNLAEPY